MDKHGTYLEKTYPSGAQKWVCLSCGHEAVWQFPPLKLKSIVLVEGDQSVYHVGNKGIKGVAEVDLQADADDEVFPADLRDEIEDALGDIEE